MQTKNSPTKLFQNEYWGRALKVFQKREEFTERTQKGKKAAVKKVGQTEA